MVDVNLQNVENVNSEDIVINYDSSKLEFAGLQQCEDVKILKRKNKGGELRIVSIHNNFNNTKRNLFTLRFKAKSLGKTNIKVSNGNISCLNKRIRKLNSTELGSREMEIN